MEDGMNKLENDEGLPRNCWRWHMGLKHPPDLGLPTVSGMTKSKERLCKELDASLLWLFFDFHELTRWVTLFFRQESNQLSLYRISSPIPWLQELCVLSPLFLPLILLSAYIRKRYHYFKNMVLFWCIAFDDFMKWLGRIASGNEISLVNVKLFHATSQALPVLRRYRTSVPL